MEFYENQLRLQLKLLAHQGHWTQVHCQDVQTKKLVSRELLYGEEKVIAWAKAFNGKGNCFLGRNPRVQDGQVLSATCLSLDLDPIRPKDSAATEDAWKEAIEAGRKIVSHFRYGVLCSSGNGALILFPLKNPVTKDVAEACGKALEAEARRIVEGRQVNDKPTVVVDATFDAARLVKALGTISTKGDRTLWRHAKVLSNHCSGTGSRGFQDWLIQPSVRNGEHVGGSESVVGDNKIQSFGPEDPYKALQLATESLKRIKPERASNYDDWLKVGIILKDFGPAGFRLWKDWSKKSEKYEEGACEAKWNSFRADQSLTVGTLKFWADQDAPLVPGGADREIVLVTPQTGLAGYRQRSTGGQPELPTGFSEIDRATFGLVRGSLFTVGARTNTGKTTFAIGTALSLCKAGKRVLFVSTESTYQEIWDRYIASATGISAFTLQHGISLNGSTDKFNAFVEVFTKEHALIVYDGSRPNIHIVRKAVEQANPDVLIFDYFQHVEGRDTRELEEFVMCLKELSKEKNIAVMMCAQLHDGAVNPKTNKLYTPTLGSIKNCKALNDESRVVLLLDWDRDAAQGDGPAAVKVLMAKNKGARQDCVLKLDRSVPRFTDDKETGLFITRGGNP